MKRIVIIGGGFAGLCAAALLAKKKDHQVTLVEKNDTIGGRARLYSDQGFHFDMGPSWYLMPEVFDRFFTLFDKKREDYFSTKELETYYKVFFESDPPVTISKDKEKNRQLFASLEQDGDKKLDEYLKMAKYKYEVAMGEFLYKEYEWIGQFFNGKVVKEGLKLDLFASLDKYVGKYFKDHRAKKILEYAMVFLGNSPKNAPALYSIMSHVDLNLGVFFPKGGLNGVAEGIAKLAREVGVDIRTSAEVKEVLVEDKRVKGVRLEDQSIEADIIINAGDYPHGELDLLDKKYQSIKEGAWKKKTIAPSMFIAYIGVNKEVPNLEHHNLYFSDDWNEHFKTIFDKPSWPDNPCFYLSAITKTDKEMAPKGKENLFLLVPIAPGLEITPEFKEAYWQKCLDHVEKTLDISIRDNISSLRLYGPDDFAKDYNAYKGTALGLAHTLFQTAIFRPAHRSKKVKGLYYTGQYTHPGVGVPMTLIASELVADLVNKDVYGQT
jgi:phytoene desaturase